MPERSESLFMAPTVSPQRTLGRPVKWGMDVPNLSPPIYLVGILGFPSQMIGNFAPYVALRRAVFSFVPTGKWPVVSLQGMLLRNLWNREVFRHSKPACLGSVGHRLVLGSVLENWLGGGLGKAWPQEQQPQVCPVPLHTCQWWSSCWKLRRMPEIVQSSHLAEEELSAATFFFFVFLSYANWD